MHIRTTCLVATTMALAAACGPQPGSAEWCKAAIEGKIQPSAAEQQQYSMQCAGHMMREAFGALGQGQ